MSKFNVFKLSAKQTLNHEGAPAYKMDERLALYTLAATSVIEDTFYESATQQAERLRNLVLANDDAFICRLAVYAREQMHLRSIPLVLMTELAKKRSAVKCAETITRVIQRADEITELLAYYQSANGRTGVKKLNRLSKQMQKGIANAFNKFDEYQFAKYDRDRSVTLKDALFLTHPKSKDEKQRLLFDKIAANELQTPYTWEVELSARGNCSEVWEELIASGKVGYMALLRNLRNILKSGVSAETMRAVADRIADKRAVMKSKQLPIRFYSAYREIAEMHDSMIFLESLEQAVKYSVSNIPFFSGKRVLIASDVSASMLKPISKRSKVQYYDIGLLLSMLLKEQLGDNVTTGIFGDIWKVKNLPRGNVLANTDALKKIEGEVGYSTHGYEVIEWAIKEKVHYDKIIFFTDCQMYDSHEGKEIRRLWKTYKEKYPECSIYLFNLAGHDTVPLKLESNDVHLIAGWSDRIFDMLKAVEEGSNAVREIEKIELEQ